MNKVGTAFRIAGLVLGICAITAGICAVVFSSIGMHQARVCKHCTKGGNF